MNFPRLFKKTSTGAIQFWEIEGGSNLLGDAGLITTRYGQCGTESPQETKDVIAEGKNTGKKNETTAVRQAELEAQAKWEKQKKKGYVESIEDAEGDKIDDVIEGGVLPMLAQSFSKQAEKIKFPCYIQPKYDGLRCIAILKDGKCTLWSRTRKRINSMPHIERSVEKQFKEDVILDGELYNHEFKSDFEKIVSLVRQDEPAEGHEIVLYWVYDVIMAGTNEERQKWLWDRTRHISIWTEPVRFTPTFWVQDEEEVLHYFKTYRKDGYEGAMLRNGDGKYVNKRSYDLQKVKEMQDDEFEIVGIEEGRGKLQGHVGSFICRTKSGTEFNAKMSGDTGRLREYFCDHSLWKGRNLTVQFQDLTGANGVPRFPVGLRIRELE